MSSAVEDPGAQESSTDTADVAKDAGSNHVSPSPALSCEMCQNYEINLTIMQDNERSLKEELKAAKEVSARHDSELANERGYRSDLEKKMTELATEMEDQLKDAVHLNLSLERKLEELETKQRESKEEADGKLSQMRLLCEQLEIELKTTNDKYKRLLGLNRATATELRSEPIDLPTDIDQLQFKCLQMREELIESKSARQHIEQELRDDVAMARMQLTEEQRIREGMERDLLGQVNDLHTQLGIANSQLSTAGNAVAVGEGQLRQIRDLQHTVAELEGQVAQVQHERAAVEKTAQNYKARCSALQNELDTSEAVQKDFVKLSQSLQIQLEKIRQSEQEVRWQWEDEVQSCSGCETPIVKVKPKPRCLHCGKLFCAPCVKNTVPSGSNRRPAPVCQVCHTLLNRDSKPFFAQDSN